MEMTIGNARIGSAFGKIELTVDNIKSLEESLKNRGTDWVLLSPDGELWRAKPEDLLRILMPYHPIFKIEIHT